MLEFTSDLDTFNENIAQALRVCMLLQQYRPSSAHIEI